MKKIILLITLFAFVEITPQTTRSANIEIPITIFDNSGLPESSRLLNCGIDSLATDSIDAFLGEYWLFCGMGNAEVESDCPPVDFFNAAFDVPAPPPPNSFLWGSYKDFRPGMIPYTGYQTYEIAYVTWNIATAVFISWEFPEGVAGLLQDPFGGVLFNYQMPDSGTFTHPSLIQLQSIRLELTFQNVTPVELVSFNATLINRNVKLDWTTATETNNSGFKILRGIYPAIGGTQNDDEWNTIGFVPGFGTTTEPKSYSFVDENVSTGFYKYRLKQIDFNGSFEYSNEIEVIVDFTPKEFALYQNYPNPLNPATTIKFEIPNVETTRRVVSTTLKVYDVLGNEVATLICEEKQPGTYEVEFDASALASGMYLYKIQAGTFIQTKKMILTK